MSELNIYHHELRHNEYAEFYLKYEVDKVIADLEESHKMEVEQLLMEIVKLKEAQRWRKSSEELPKENDYYLVTNGDAVYYDVFIEYGYYSEQDEEWQWEHNGKWEYWMPFPKAPEEAK